jgi:putative transferase (TIGR04331 family)
MVERTLVTTALKCTWPKNQKTPVIFLGEWCTLYSEKYLLREMNSTIVEYHWNDRRKLHSDYQYLKHIYDSLIIVLSCKLNEIHATNHSTKYWLILVGPWLGWFVQAIFDRWFMLKKAIDHKGVTKCNIINRSLIIPIDTSDFGNCCISDNWNESIYAYLLKTYWSDSISIKLIECDSPSQQSLSYKNTSKRGFIKKSLNKLILKFNKFFSKKDDYFFITSGLRLKIDFKLQIFLGQIPKIWTTPVATDCAKVDMGMRKWNIDSGLEGNDSFIEVVCQLIPCQIPRIYLEGYEERLEFTKSLPWPTQPKAIFTSYAFSSDDTFKMWAAEKVEKKVPLIIGQHGGNFGMTPFSFYEEHQIKIADRWVSWGWSDNCNTNIIPIGNLKHYGSRIRHDSNGYALMVELTLPRYSYYIYSAPIAEQWLDYFEDQKIFLKKLPKVLRKQVLLRLSTQDLCRGQKSRWKDQMPEIKIEPEPRQKITKLIKGCRLYIATSNATTYLESMYWNIPTIIFWNEKHWEIKGDIKPYFDLLKSVGIFHDTPQGAAKKMEEVWDDVDSWWLSSSVQSARKEFCKNFTYEPKNLVAGLGNVIKEVSILAKTKKG